MKNKIIALMALSISMASLYANNLESIYKKVDEIDSLFSERGKSIIKSERLASRLLEVLRDAEEQVQNRLNSSEVLVAVSEPVIPVKPVVAVEPIVPAKPVVINNRPTPPVPRIRPNIVVTNRGVVPPIPRAKPNIVTTNTRLLPPVPRAKPNLIVKRPSNQRRNRSLRRRQNTRYSNSTIAFRIINSCGQRKSRSAQKRCYEHNVSESSVRGYSIEDHVSHCFDIVNKRKAIRCFSNGLSSI